MRPATQRVSSTEYRRARAARDPQWAKQERERSRERARKAREDAGYLEKYREWSRAHRDLFRGYMKVWETKHPEKAREWRRKRSDRRKAIKYGCVAYEWVRPEEIFERDKWKCRLCGKRTPKELRGTLDENAPVMDHIIPLKLGGPHNRKNLQCLCRSCNSHKSSKYEGQLAFA
jgi:5-methylcytosine-specific restriction endonuclease McrA